MDDRLNEVDYAAEADVVAIPVECYTAARSYEIADRFRVRGITVLLGGFHTTLNPEEATEHADAIVCGDAETVWDEVLSDLCSHSLKRKYVGRGGVFCPLPDRTLFRGRPYGTTIRADTPNILSSVMTAFRCNRSANYAFLTLERSMQTIDGGIETFAKTNSLDRCVTELAKMGWRPFAGIGGRFKPDTMRWMVFHAYQRLDGETGIMTMTAFATI